ncbi:MAG: hypothetical protein E7566_08430 [Ruminococcaceae bacterium]|nr:hypothetical protein [Oscillospiraceae bacterium]
MNKEQEYIKFWMNIKEKVDDIKDDYNNLSQENKFRVDNDIKELFRVYGIKNISIFVDRIINDK